MNEKLYDKILGGLVGGAAGDAMGAATEGRSRKKILELFGHKVTCLEKPPMDTFGAGNEPGGFTDDFSSAYFVARAVIDNGGIVEEECVKKALVEWSTHHEFFDRFAGPTTRLAIRRFAGESIPESNSIKNLNRQATNGSAMRIAPIGLINAGNVDKAITDAVIVAEVTHKNSLALSGACAISAAVSKACEETSDLVDVVNSGLYGAKKGEEIGIDKYGESAGPSVYKRIELAIELAYSNKPLDDVIVDIADTIGTGLHISEAVPSAFGFFIACRGLGLPTVVETINAGYDTDTVGTIAGALAGTYSGVSTFTTEMIDTMENVNGLDIVGLAKDITQTVENNFEQA